MKKMFRMMLCAALLAMAVSIPAFAAEQEVPEKQGDFYVLVNGQYVTFTDAVPQIKDSRSCLPFVAVFEQLGFAEEDMTWDGATKTVTAAKDDTTISLTIGKTAITLSTGTEAAKEISTDVAPYVAPATSRTYVPFGLVADALGYSVGWDAQQKAVIIDDVDAILAAGGTPSADLVGASGYTNEYVQAREAAYKREQAQSRSRSSSGSGGSSGGRSSGGGTGYNNAGLTTSQIQQMQTALGVTPDGMWGPETQAAAGGLSADQAWAIMSGGDGGGQDPGASVTNQTGDGWIRVAGYSRITWQELEAMVNRGEIIETYNPETGKYSYRKNPNYGK